MKTLKLRNEHPLNYPLIKYVFLFGFHKDSHHLRTFPVFVNCEEIFQEDILGGKAS